MHSAGHGPGAMKPFRLSKPLGGYSVPSMPKHPVITVNAPADEWSRLQALRSLAELDTASDTTLDDLVRMAARAFRCPISAISLVSDDRQWLKAAFGLELRQTTDFLVFCGQTIRHNGVFVVSDAALDPDCAEHPLVTGHPQVRFYAGVPIRVDAHVVGTLFVVDRQPRTLNEDERALLVDLAQAVEHRLATLRERMYARERENDFRELAEQMPGIVYRAALDEASSTLYVSSRIRELGYTAEEWIARPDAWLQALHPDDRERVLGEHARGVARGQPFELRYRLCDAAGRWRQIEDAIRIVRPSGDAGVSLIQGVMLDVTDRAQTQGLDDLLLRHLPDGVLLVDAGHRVLEANPRAEQLLGLPRNALVQRPLAELFNLAVSEETTRHLLAGDAQGLEWDYRHPDGSLRYLEDTARTLADGRQIRVLRDVARQREESNRLRRLSLAAEQASEAIVITDLAANIEYVNQAAVTSSGYSREELIGRNSRMLQSGLTPMTRHRKLWATLIAGRSWRGFLNNRRKDGSLYIEFATISPVRAPDGRVTHYLAVKEDITEKRRMGEDLNRYRHHLEDLVTQRTDELERARRAAEAASTAKSDFLATMSHEIRTPMNGVIGVADVLMRSSLNPHQMELTGTIRESAFALLSIIDDILNYSKIEAGRMVLEQAPMNLLRLAEGACDVVHPMALVQGVRLHVFADPALPAALIGDAARVRQVIINLVGNAIKFSAGQDRPGRVALRLLPLAGGGLRLDVSDNGIGMSPEVQARIFQPFEQGESSTSRTYGGTGLGLVICQRLVDAMGGRIRVASTPGVGSSFSVELPLPAHGVERPAPVPHDLDGLECVLVLDDEALVQDWATYLSAAGAVVSRGEALPVTNAPVEPSAGTTVLILSVERQRLLQSLGQSLPPGLRTVLVRHAERGAPRFVQPTVVELEVGGVHRDELLLAVAMAAGRASALPMDAEPPQNAQAPAVPDPAQAAAQGCLILVAEDNAINRKVIRHQLELLGLASELVASGQDALDCWRADPGRYGLLLTDLHMPGLDGFALAAAIRREEPTGQRLPIIASTANVQGMDAARCREVGMDACMSKPVALDVLNDTLRHWLGRGKTGAGPVAMTAPPPPAVAAVSAPRGDAALHGFDDSALTRLVGPDDAFQLDLCQRYLDSLDQALDDIGRAIASEDWRAAGLVAHRLRTSTLALGAVGLGRVFEAMEIAGRENDAQALRQQALWLGPAADTVRRHLRRQ